MTNLPAVRCLSHKHPFWCDIFIDLIMTYCTEFPHLVYAMLTVVFEDLWHIKTCCILPLAFGDLNELFQFKAVTPCKIECINLHLKQSKFMNGKLMNNQGQDVFCYNQLLAGHLTNYRLYQRLQ